MEEVDYNTADIHQADHLEGEEMIQDKHKDDVAVQMARHHHHYLFWVLQELKDGTEAEEAPHNQAVDKDSHFEEAVRPRVILQEE
jgi:hypothetical protein